MVDGAVRLTYRQFGRRVNRLANALRGLGLERGARVAMLDRNSHRFAEAYYACTLAGLALLPLNTRLAQPELERILGDSEARALLASAPFESLVGETASRAPALEVVAGMGFDPLPAGFADYETLLADASDRFAGPEGAPGDLVQIYYTSGTTGDPKGVCLTGANVFYCGLDCVGAMDFRPGCVWLHCAPMFHLADAVAFWAVPMVGGTQVCVRFEPERALRLIESERVTITSLPATLIAMTADSDGLSGHDLSSLTQVMYGGSPTPLGTLRKAAGFLPPGLLLHTYGITETTGIVCTLHPADHDLSPSPDGPCRAASCGTPTPLTELRVVVGDGEDLPAGGVGEVVCGGPKIMRGYWRRPDLTDDVLRDGWYRTGDMGYLDDTGHLYLVDRRKDMIITGGENVYSTEVENVLSTHPAVREAAVVGIPHDVWGEQVHAVVVRRDGFEETAARDVLDFCRGRIAGYKIPKSLEFADGPLPTTGPGKIAKRRLRDPWWEGTDRRV